MEQGAIAEKLNHEHILPPLDYRYEKLGKPVPSYSRHLWQAQTVKRQFISEILHR